MSAEDSETSRDLQQDEAVYLFPAFSLGGPVEELEATAEKKLRMYSNLGEQESAERLRSAVALARKRLETVLSAPKTTIGS
jgi:hypothetical protein